MAENIKSSRKDVVERRIYTVINHLLPLPSRPVFPPFLSRFPVSGKEDSYRRVHGQVELHRAEWRLACDESGKDFSDIIYEKAVGEWIAKITINRPERRNAFRPQTVKELIRAFNDARDDEHVGVIIFTGKGTEAFCSGGDQALRSWDNSLSQDMLKCPLCSISEETSDHLFLTCPVATLVWSAIFQWLNVSFVSHQDLKCNFTQFGFLFIGKSCKKFRYLIWYATIWAIWLIRNGIIFQEKAFDLVAIIDHIKFLSWNWLCMKKGVKLGFQFVDWKSSSPLVSLHSIGESLAN